jgi:hypothetical protein
MTIRPYVTDKQGNLVSGNFYFPMTDIDVLREGNHEKFGLLYGTNDLLQNYNESYNNFSETVMIGQGVAANADGDKVYIPGAAGDSLYTPKIEYNENNQEYTVTAAVNAQSHANNNFYSGFMTLVQNGDFVMTYRGSRGQGYSGMNTNILCGTEGSDYNYRLRHSTETLPSSKNPNPAATDGGTILTTR